MSTEENKAVVRRLFAAYMELWPTGNWAPLEALLASDVIYQDPSAPLRGREAVFTLLSMYREAFPDATNTIEDQVAEGDKVVTRWSARGTHQGSSWAWRPPPSRRPSRCSASIGFRTASWWSCTTALTC